MTPASPEDDFQDFVKLLVHLGVRESNDVIAQLRQSSCPGLIASLTTIVRVPVDFNDQSRSSGVEIHDETVDHVLPSELASLQSAGTQAPPKLLFRRGHVRSETSRVCQRGRAHTMLFRSTRHSTLPLTPSLEGSGKSAVRGVFAQVLTEPSELAFQDIGLVTGLADAVGFAGVTDQGRRGALGFHRPVELL